MLFIQAESFVEVARQGGVRRAAEVLAISQPALTARLHALERELGTPLFEREPSGMTLTPAGRAFLPHAERALEAITDGIALVRELEHGTVGELSLGVAHAIGAYVLPEVLANFWSTRPDVRLRVRTGHSEEIVEEVARGEVDLGIVRELSDPRVTSRPLYEDELVLVVRPDHPFAHAPSVHVREMQTVQLILFDRTSSYYSLTNALFRSAGITPRAVTEVDNVETAKRMVERGLGVALLPATAVADALGERILREIELLGVRPVSRRIVLLERRAGRRTPVVEAFLPILDRIPDLIPGAKRIPGTAVVGDAPHG